MFNGLEIIEIKYYAISKGFEIHNTNSVHSGLTLENNLLVIRHNLGKFHYNSQTTPGNIWTNKFYGFSLFVDNFGPVSTIQNNGWEVRFSETTKVGNDYDVLILLITDPEGQTYEKRGFATKNVEDIVSAISTFYAISKHVSWDEFSLHNEIQQLKLENERLRKEISNSHNKD